ncbi:MAG: hypothetical protein PHD21_06045 [Flavobacteriales bacterium]|nr:hypothetical protein [Flavobacteriales bacterium]
MAGDTRFDRVVDILVADNELPFMDTFTQGNKVIVVGSAWEDDYRVIAHVINSIKTPRLKYVVAPHQMNYAAISAFRNALKVPSMLYSQLSGDALFGSKVLILDTIGILTKVYSYAHISYVGGGWTPTGIHNVLEPAVFARPVVCGPRYDMYNEAVGMKKKGGLLVVSDEKEAEDVFSSLLSDENKYQSAAVSAGEYVKENSGATVVICGELFSVVDKNR